ncbi:MAG: hypothetical protein ABI629_16730 [bacterium]
MRSRLAVLAVALCATLAAPAHAQPAEAQIAADLGLPGDAVQRIEKGEMVATYPRSGGEREIAVRLAFLVKAPPSTVVAGFSHGSDFSDDPTVTASHTISANPSLADFASLTLTPNGAAEAQRYVTAKPGVKLNLSAAEIAAFAALGKDASQSAVEAQVRQMLLARLQAYRTQGFDGVAPYARSDGETRRPPTVIRRSSQSPVLKRYALAFQTALLNYPNDPAAGMHDDFYWMVSTLDGRPNIALRQRLSVQVGPAYALADREFYVSHGYNAMQAIAALLPTADGYTVMYYGSRTTTDQVGGFGSSAKRAIGARMMATQLKAIFDKTRAAFAK